MTTDAWGVDDEYEDALGAHRFTSAESRAAIHRAMGVEPDAEPEPHSVWVVKRGKQNHIACRGEIELETGGRLAVAGTLPLDVPLGYHQLHLQTGPAIRLIVTPGRCYLPPDLKIWGWAVQLYAARSSQSWGIGDLRDLATLGRWSRDLGAGIVITNPLDAVAPGLPQESSPYYPSSRRFRNPLYLRIEDVPGFAELAGALGPLAVEGRALNAQPLIDRRRVYRLKMQALSELWGRFGAHAGFEAYCREQGESLKQFAAYCALADRFGQNWREWSSEFRRWENPAVQRFVDEHRSRWQFFQWLQWLLDEQLASAAAELPLMQDLPIGASPCGADAWAWQGILAEGATMGVPPDMFNTLGQNWGLPPLVPHKLRAAGYQPFVEIVRSALRHAGGLRIDHVLGLFRSFWIPDGFHAKDGAYVRYPVDDLLDIISLESVRAQAFVVGEDLGTVEHGVREKLADHNMLSYALVCFEDRPLEQYPHKAIAAVTTHDLPTVAGLWSGRDLAEQQFLQLAPNVDGDRTMREKIRVAAEVEPTASADAVIAGVHAALGRAPSMVISATLEDALAVEERPNMPNTISSQRANWSMALPLPIEQLAEVARAGQIAASLSRGGRERPFVLNTQAD